MVDRGRKTGNVDLDRSMQDLYDAMNKAVLKPSLSATSSTSSGGTTRTSTLNSLTFDKTNFTGGSVYIEITALKANVFLEEFIMYIKESFQTTAHVSILSDWDWENPESPNEGLDEVLIPSTEIYLASSEPFLIPVYKDFNAVKHIALKLTGTTTIGSAELKWR